MSLVDNHSNLPLIVCGPILRRLESQQVVLWLTSSRPLSGEFELFATQQATENEVSNNQQLEQVLIQRVALTNNNCQQLQIGQQAWTCLLEIHLDQPLVAGQQYFYDLQLAQSADQLFCLSRDTPQTQLTYASADIGQPQRPSLIFRDKLSSLLHGSCRLPHSDCPDAMITCDQQLQQKISDGKTCPDLLLLTGDQIYADSVAGPLLIAIQIVINKLGLWHESFANGSENGFSQQEPLTDSQQLIEHSDNLYQRQKLLPTQHATMPNKKADRFLAKIGFERQPEIFTSTHQENHLISMAEFNAMYLLVWSPALWPYIWQQLEFQQSIILSRLEKKQQRLWHKELKQIKLFAKGLPACARVMANVPCYMIFDDHDVTDDWNLTAGWEQAAYGHPFSKQIIGNGLISYFLFQGWGNNPSVFVSEILPELKQLFSELKPTLATETVSVSSRFLQIENHQQAINKLLKFERWHYSLPTTPMVVVLDSRTRRWRSERNLNKPSGLLDWEALTEAQQQMINQPSVILVAPAPIFGVKFIETIQRLFTWLGHPLVVDAENWMAHPGTANTLLNIFLHRKTPQNFIILSGDVHYSFVYDVSIRFRRNSPRIWQFTCSGIKNRFPSVLLKILEAGNRFFFGDYSLFNWFTKRKRMRIRQRSAQEEVRPRLINQSAIGYLELDQHGAPTQTGLWQGNGKLINLLPEKKSCND
ncbi:alkaline phosphatase family protein [Pelagibaculum spongiae]|uniref:PhoD-like phosphatase metallophosphatase domain-containing protein n=1 Tax=Pelagibaculum spongiae TaxID=2080658 RepID=A0A2V1GRL4_9GAMM|nr:alkaline phosphatase family protein [Pelagibaculum spongiae]PVZ67728.1 hypothetical protein DC094_14945 [Pelagibaculum spongiae]